MNNKEPIFPIELCEKINKNVKGLTYFGSYLNYTI